MTEAVWSAADSEAALELLAIDTTTPMETGAASDIAAGQQALAARASAIGFEIDRLEVPVDPGSDEWVPLPVRARLAELGTAFLDWQPNLVLRLGPPRLADACLLFNVHMDTVAPFVPPRLANGVLAGRGVADAKGLAIAVLAGVRRAMAVDPGLSERATILLQSPAGEEGGAMGVYGTRALVAAGSRGRLNIVCEPTRMIAVRRTTSAMTARIQVSGTGSTDDDPCRGENASILLGALAGDLARELAPAVALAGGRMCISGLCTGHAHNRVYGQGMLKVNIAYGSPGAGEEIGPLVESWLPAALARFSGDFASTDVAAAIAARAASVTELVWEKRGLPLLDNRDDAMAAVLQQAGIASEADAEPPVFTCDAMWFQHPQSHACVLGPGDLGANGAHTEHEFLEIEDLAAFAEAVSRICLAFAGRDGRT